ncbi:MAG: diguanylate cyclase [Thermosynechococcaceae cyanobacterium]
MTPVQYRIVNLLSESSNSLVYRANRLIDEQPVILKTLREEYPPPERLAWFKREYDLLASLNLPGVVGAYAFERHQNRLTIILEDFGGDALNRLPLAGTLTLHNFLHLALSIVKALGQVHEANVVHKDINPANIVLNSATGQVKLIDFGIATVLSRESTPFLHPSQLQGTLAYMSPEQTGRMNCALDYRTDFYSLGVTLYALLTGQLPFEGNDLLAWVHSHIAKKPIPPRDRMQGADSLSQHHKPTLNLLSDILMKLLAKNAEERYQSAFGLQVDLNYCLETLHSGQRIPNFRLGSQDMTGQFSLPQKLYGRESDLKTLLTRFERASLGACEILLVMGESGVGKSAFIREVYKPITSKNAIFISGKYEQYKQNIPYYALSQAFNEFCMQLLIEDASILEEWRAKILNKIGLNSQVLVEVIPNLELIIGSQPSMDSMGPQETQNLFTLAFQDFIHAICQPEHPFVIFLDDLQWADHASLNLLKTILCDRMTQNLLVIGAYRHNEVDPLHPLQTMLNEVRDREGKVSQILIENLTKQNINELLSDTLNCDSKKSDDLADLIYQKTKGNAFFVIEFIKSIYSEGLLKLEQNKSSNQENQILPINWTWNLQEIRAKNITDNVVDLMIENLTRFPVDTQTTLMFAACIGNRFNLKTLATIRQKSPRLVLTDLWSAVQEGFVIPMTEQYQLFVDLDVLFLSPMASRQHHEPQESTSRDVWTELELPAENVQFKFNHDRVQQAAYSLIPVEQRPALHHQIGTLLLADTVLDDCESEIFAIVNQLNRGIALVNDLRSREELIQLNLAAGRKALAGSAYGAANEYLQVGLALLAPDHWQTQYSLALELYEAATEAAYLTGDFAQQTQLASMVLQYAASPMDRIKAYEVSIQALVAQNQLAESVQVAQQCLQTLGIEFPETPQPSDFQAAFQETLAQLADRSCADLLNLPEMTDLQAKAVLRILHSIHTPVYMSNPALFPLTIFKQVNLSLQSGNTALSATAYAYYGLILVGIVGDTGTGYQFGRLALNLLARLNAPMAKSSTFLIAAGAVLHWQEPIRDSLAALREGYQSGRDTGDFQSGAFCLSLYGFHAYFSGKELISLLEELKQCGEAMAQLNQTTAIKDNFLYQQIVLNLMGEGENPYEISGSVYHETEMIAWFEQTHNITSAAHLYINKLILCYTFDQFDQALLAADTVAPTLVALVGTVMVPLFHFYDALTRLALYPQASPCDQDAVMAKVDGALDKLQAWSRYAPMNYSHKVELVAAEKARVLGQYWQAATLYERALQQAQENGYLQEEALICEVAADFYNDQAMESLARFYLHKAHHAYRRWGATAKVKQLEVKYPQYLYDSSTEIPAHQSTLSTYNQSISTALDLNSIMKASQTLSSEIERDKLLIQMMAIILENAGAEKGFLLLDHNGSWVVHASGTVEENTTILEEIPLISQDNKLLSMSIVNYVARAQESVVLQNASQEDAFAQDPYIAEFQPQSVLCLPLLKQGKLMGILYLENNLISGAFTPDRLETIRLICSQAAISIENAQLYEQLKQYSQNLEQIVAARTQELEKANQTLYSLANLDGLTQIANRRRFDAYLLQEWKRSQRKEQSLSLILCDVDHFKQYNDCYGHKAGDICLQRIAQVLQMVANRSVDLAARYGGEEFVILLPNTDLKGAIKVVENLRSQVEQLQIPHAQSSVAPYVTLSLGIAYSASSHVLSPEDLIVVADRALYEAKDAGRNTYRVYSVAED